ncbi:TIGR03619 family F420-dependent LLM class oxidoreductase [Nocardia cyriacigeorgica]|uniref:F420-dependent glucose-6-phosphate dehydrogenase n=1 Tax=Nocardia cyriacigeorgica TaxID=135487 RepID=A0A4U8WGZ3_9NOCA|nr:TIGR03619 family F420-dependent LLM class oxidoreductase [Nocardia cyriacigeorgica]MBF6099358.1 TIGR03619 family F420-dependent LLM class oxidoreductase [Nocardia cyriacigeorgica]MBF6161030.1 TIGR03619 family F420-dependent LLM class oxidoreductase [Nocardia cyriacigeorgica]MBF6199829.1 TIGR03619 family F420-dependent LLM class oxidoreductase [Nocardia cyriacigeorgica]MBF6319544.1 TIGR03619 family F420-dependent LLM class oxidoreductase [Nocardia cyriacigeorgica]MBF6343624.1 TIGR03619 famil
MKFAVSYPTPFNGTDPDRLVSFARHAERCGFEALYVQDHIALYPGANYGAGELPPTLPYFDPLDCLSFVAATTERLLLGTGILLLPYRHPVVLAKRLATIDVLSKGRMRLLTVGLGALPGEARAMGVDFRSRGRRADEAIDVLRLLWSGGPEGVDYHGEFFDLEKLCSYPKPAVAEGLPIHIGGSSRAAARRAGTRGNGYFAGGMLDEDERDLQLDLARKAAADAGRDPAALEYTRWGSIDATVERVEQLAEHGVTRIVVNVTAATAEEQHDQMSAFAERFGLTTTSDGGRQ